MAFDKMQFYRVHFNLPDGEHIIAGFSSANIETARKHYARIIGQNPEATFNPANVIACTAAEVDDAIDALRAKDPSRPLATDLGLDSPARILTNPEVVPGSQHIPAIQGLAE